MPSMFKNAPNDKPAISFLSKAWQHFQPKNPKDAVEADVYRKSRDVFPNEIYPELTKPFGPDKDLSPKTTLSKSLDRSKPTAINNSFKSPRLSIKRYKYPWMKQLNTENTPKPTDKTGEQYEAHDDEGLFTVELIKHPNGYLGIVLVGGIDTPLRNHYVNSILPSSSASKSGRVRVGDELLEVNGHNLQEATHAEALLIFRCLPSVVKLVIARSKDANRSVLKLLENDSTLQKKKNNNLSSEGDSDRPKSAFQAAADTSVVPKSVSSVVDVTKWTGSGLPGGQWASRCSSFIASNEYVKGSREKPSGDPNSARNKSDHAACSPTSDKSSTWFSRRNTICGSKYLLQTLNEGNVLPDSNLFLRGAPFRHSMINGTWPSDALRQRTPFPWEHSKHVTMKRSSSAKMRSSAAVTSGNAGAKKFSTSTGKNYQIEKETMSVQIYKEDSGAGWGFTIGGGLLSPYGDLPIYIVDVSGDGPVCDILRSGDEIVEFNGGSFGSMTLMEAERSLGRTTKEATVTIKRKFLQRTGSVREQSNPYAADHRSPK